MSTQNDVYLFVDKSGHCFEDFQDYKGHDEDEAKYRDHLGAMLRAGRKFHLGDMMFFRDDLINAGFSWGKDFYVRKIEAKDERAGPAKS